MNRVVYYLWRIKDVIAKGVVISEEVINYIGPTHTRETSEILTLLIYPNKSCFSLCSVGGVGWGALWKFEEPKKHDWMSCYYPCSWRLTSWHLKLAWHGWQPRWLPSPWRVW
jgi:hypothetical protein